jgi:hypothetical protein
VFDSDDAFQGESIREANPELGDPTAGTGLWASNTFGTDAASLSTLARILNGTATTDDWLKTLGTAGSTALGMLGAKDQGDAIREQTNALQAMQNQYLNMGAPYRDRLNASYAPGFNMASDPAYTQALDQSANAILRKLSTQGNPFDNPGGVMEANRYVTQNVALPQLNAYRSQLGTFGNLGVNTAGTAGLNAAQSAGMQNNSGMFNALGYGINQLTNPTSSLDEMIKKLGGLA